MFTTLLCLTDGYARSMEAMVIGVYDDRYVELDQTVFYPQGGGQPGDSGTLFCGDESFRVINTTKKDGHVLHEIDRAGLSFGDTVRGVIDWERRYAHMRHHTAAHVLSSIFHERAGALITGNQIYADKLRIDFSLADYDPVRMQHYIDEANRLLSLDAPVTARTLARNDALKLPGVVKLAGALPPEIPELRILTIGDSRTGIIDEQADGGTHVHSTKEVGNVLFASSENKGKNNRRLTVTLSI